MAERRTAVTTLATGAVVLSVSLVGLLLATWGLEQVTQGTVPDGVWCGDRLVGGRSGAALDSSLEAIARDTAERPRAVRVGTRLFAVKLADVGIAVDIEATRRHLLATRRTGGIGQRLAAWSMSFVRPTSTAPILHVVDAARLAAALERWQREAVTEPPFPGNVVVAGTTVKAQLPRAGDRIDRQAARVRLLNPPSASEAIDVPLERVAPRLKAADVDAATKLATRIVSGSVELVHPSRRLSLRVTKKDLARALLTRVVGSGADGRLDVLLDEAVVRELLDKVRAQLERSPRDARFVVDDQDRITIVPHRRGSKLDVAALAYSLREAALTPGRVAILPVREDALPNLTTEKARALGIQELVARFTTYHPCCQKRVENIHRIADLLDGTVVLPGQTFSVNKTIGPRTTKNGFVAAPTIVHGEMQDSLGGGISQFATTMFNAVLRGGYEIVQRQPHTYWFRRYPEAHEATLSYPEPDLSFKNDTKAGMLIRCEYGRKFIRVKIFGDKEGRRVKLHKSKRFDIVKPNVELIADDKVDPAEEEVEERGKVGWSVKASRVVTFADGTSKKEERKVIYSPRVRRIRVHSCRIPEGEEGYTGKDCPVPEDADADAEGTVAEDGDPPSTDVENPGEGQEGDPGEPAE